MTPIRYTRAQVKLMILFALLEGKSATPASFDLRKDGAGYIWQTR